MDKKKIVYVGNFDFPFGSAAGKRVYGNGKLLRAIGYEPIFVGMSRKVDSMESLQETEKEYDGFKYYCYPYPKKFEGLGLLSAGIEKICYVGN